MADQFSTVVTIDSIPANVWTVLTDPEIIPDWMGEPEMGIKILEFYWRTTIVKIKTRVEG
jgi:uncharacterized protein YndB with AHSA1/START domain